ncbi:T9SS type A sorting domain-containing protein [Flavobacterium adhaerens]|uniref:T9SS type A sorting domain-containing protein n=1 Tax=Flavobacterium adhaerens TaxID=3149043 RepID=UPI0032B32E76
MKGISQNGGTVENNLMETIITSGNNAVGSSGTVAYSIGQVIYTYIEQESDYTVAQGIQQLFAEENLGTPDVEESIADVLIFPNPTVDLVHISMKDQEFGSDQRSYKLYDIQGRLLKQNKISQVDTQVNLSSLSPSIYVLLVYTDNKVLKSFKIIKK